jgi:hypothetical protein
MAGNGTAPGEITHVSAIPTILDHLQKTLFENDWGFLRRTESTAANAAKDKVVLELDFVQRNEPHEIVLSDANDAAQTYELILAYFRRNGYDRLELFSEYQIIFDVCFDPVRKTADDLKRDLGLFEIAPMLKDYSDEELTDELARRSGLTPEQLTDAIATKRATVDAASEARPSTSMSEKPVPTTIAEFRAAKQIHTKRRRAQAAANEPPEIQEAREIMSAGDCLRKKGVTLTIADRDLYNAAQRQLRTFVELNQPQPEAA